MTRPLGRSGLAVIICALALSCSRLHARSLDLNGSRGQRVFFVLGFLDEYTGRHVVEGDDRVESFYCNESAKVPGFVHQLEQLVGEQHLDARVRLETVEGCVTVVRSEPLADALNALYQSRDAPRIDESWTIDESGRRRRNETLWAGPQLFRGAARELELAYVAGAYARYGHGEDLRFANARQKVALIASLLNELGCANVHVESTEGVIPQPNTIHFEPTPELRGRMAHPPL